MVFAIFALFKQFMPQIVRMVLLWFDLLRLCYKIYVVYL